MIKVIIPILLLAGAAIAVIMYCLCVAAGREKKKSPCDGCPYGRGSPCIGYCIRQLQGKKVD